MPCTIMRSRSTRSVSSAGMLPCSRPAIRASPGSRSAAGGPTRRGRCRWSPARSGGRRCITRRHRRRACPPRWRGSSPGSTVRHPWMGSFAAASPISGSSPSTLSTTATAGSRGPSPIWRWPGWKARASASTACRPRSSASGPATTRCWSGPRRAPSTSPHGSPGSSPASAVPSREPKWKAAPSCARPSSGAASPKSPCRRGRRPSSIASSTASRAS